MEPEQELKEIGHALAELVSAVIRDDDERAAARGLLAPSKSVRLFRVLDRLAGTDASRAAQEFFDKPVREALRNAVRLLGERLYEVGGTATMEDALDQVADLDPETRDRRAAVMEHAWSGIGSWMA